MRLWTALLPVLLSVALVYLEWVPANTLTTIKRSIRQRKPSIEASVRQSRNMSAGMMSPQSFNYAKDKEILVWLPDGKEPKNLPLMLFFHGGGLVKGLGDLRQITQPHRRWQIEMALKRGVALASPSYSLLPDYNASDILNDIDALWSWLQGNPTFDMTKIGVTGSSAGCFVADQTCLRCNPPPKAIGRQWGMAGDLLSAFWTEPHRETPAYLADLDKGNFLVHTLLKGDYLDAFTGRQGFAEDLRKVPEADREKAAPADLLHLFPQLNLSPNFPPTALVHGTADTIVPVAESTKRADSLRAFGVEVQLDLVEGGEHGLINSKEPEDVVQAKRERMCAFVLDRMLA